MRLNSIAVLALLAALPAVAADVSLIGTFGTTAAILSVDGGAPKTVKVGQSYGGVTLIAVENDRATVQAGGKRRVLARGQTYSSSGASSSGNQSVTLSAGAGGHFMADGQINGGAIRFLVDTGATAISIPASDANRLRIDYRNGQRGTTQTAAGPTTAFLVKLDTVRIGGIELQNVDAIVIEQGLPIALLGNTFLNRMEMRRDGATMTLTRRF
ncbi:MAG: TIGR02281 family clan AA aspartic protease [Betaproteobacteria bacterium]